MLLMGITLYIYRDTYMLNIRIILYMYRSYISNIYKTFLKFHSILHILKFVCLDWDFYIHYQSLLAER